MKLVILSIATLLSAILFIPDNNLRPIEDSSSYVEVNHVYYKNEDDQIYKRFIQVIWWEWRDVLLLPVLNNLGEETGEWRSSSGFDMRARETANICCSPPESEPADCNRRS